jgi:transcriptional regulator with XRE-family HTH domain
MKIEPKRVLDARRQKAWTQDELAVASGLNLRTIQRIEKDGQVSLQSAKALAAALDLDVQDFVQDFGAKESPVQNPMRSCPECGSNQVFRYLGDVDMYAMNGDLLPKLGGMVTGSKTRPVVCADCGYLRYFVSPTSIERMKSSSKWRLWQNS